MPETLVGQWLGRYSGTNTGTLVLDLDLVGENCEGWFSAWDDEAALPASTAPVRISKYATSGTIHLAVLAVHPITGMPAQWNEVATYYPAARAPSSAEARFELHDDVLHVSATTNILTHIDGTLRRSKAEMPTEFVPKPHVQDWQSYKSYVADLEPRKYIYRGQQEPRRLRTAFHRAGRSDLRRFLVDDRPTLHRHLSARTKHLFDLNVPEQNGAFLSLVQHHGYPTPLLDWTYSPYIAAFFAYRRITNVQAAALSNLGKKVRIFIFDVAEWCNDFIQHLVLSPNGPHFSVMHFLAVENERLIPQQSVSTVTNLDDIETFLQGAGLRNNKSYLEIVDLPMSERRRVMQELSVMGITAGSMFPGLDGACEELKERMFP